MEKETLSYTTHPFNLERVEEGKKTANKVIETITFAFAKGGVENWAVDCF